MSSTRSEQFEALARVHHTRSAAFLRSAHEFESLFIHRDMCLKLAYESSKHATKCYALAREYRLRGE